MAWSCSESRVGTDEGPWLKREFSEAKWTEARAWTMTQLIRTKNSKYRPSDKQKQDPAVARANERLAARIYQLMMGHCLTGQCPQ